MHHTNSIEAGVGLSSISSMNRNDVESGNLYTHSRPASNAAAARKLSMSRRQLQWELDRYMKKNVCCMDPERGYVGKRLTALQSKLVDAALRLSKTVWLYIVLLATEAIVTCTIVKHMMDMDVPRDNRVMFAVAVASNAIMYLIACSSPPGFISTGSKTKTGAGDEYCNQCNSWRLRADRAYHCRRCNACVLKMDHHCMFTNNCVGRFNLHIYYMYEWSTLVVSSVGAWTLAMACLFSPAVWSWPIILLTVLSLVLASLSAFGGMYLVALHSFFIARNLTMLDFFRMKLKKPQGEASDDIWMLSSPEFDLGFRGNLAEFLAST